MIGKAGWQLLLAGAESVVLGFAQWDDQKSFENLVNSLNDNEALVALGSMLNPDIIAALSQRTVIREMRRSRTFPVITQVKAKTVLAAANLLTPPSYLERESYSDSAGKIRALQVKTGAKSVAVAVALLAPAKNPIRPKVAHNFRSVSVPFDRAKYKAEQAARRISDTEHYKREVAPWREAAAAAFVAAGWRVVDLPAPKGVLFRGDAKEESVLWVTLVNEETWDSIKPAIDEVLVDFNFDRYSF